MTNSWLRTSDAKQRRTRPAFALVVDASDLMRARVCRTDEWQIKGQPVVFADDSLVQEVFLQFPVSDGAAATQ
eukprot:8560814-Pyramimonas_sp.AAC.2